MKNKKHIIIFSIAIVLMLCSITSTFARYVISKTKSVTITTSANLDSGTVNFSITNQNNIYTVANQTDRTTIQSTVLLENTDNIPINSYYAWTTTNEEPNENAYQSFNFTNNSFTAQNTNVGIGTYYLWAKVTYSSEIGEAKEVKKSSRAINIFYGAIDITLDDEISDYLTGDVGVTISYTGNYTYNTKAGLGKTEALAIQNASSATANSLTILEENIDDSYYIYAYAENSAGNSIYVVREINNIDNVNPIINNVTQSFARIKVNLEDTKSGIKEYTVTTTTSRPASYTYSLATAQASIETYIDNLTQNTTYYLWVKDACRK